VASERRSTRHCSAKQSTTAALGHASATPGQAWTPTRCGLVRPLPSPSSRPPEDAVREQHSRPAQRDTGEPL
jgi:hypothetical protein